MVKNLLNNRYRLDALIGQGGMGEIYRAHDSLLQRDVAVKVMAKVKLGTEGRARLLNEARAAAKLNHPNIVSIFDAGEADGSPYIVMELVEGESLFDLRPGDLGTITKIAQQICLALEQAHLNGIIHRDLKPENVLVLPSGSAKLTDFGMARSLSSRLTEEGIISGTVYYMAPEIALGQAVDGRSDLYSLGVILYELCAGRLPFTADNPLGVISQHIHAPAVPPSSFRPDLPRPIEAVIMKLLAKSPTDRYPDAKTTLQALKEADKGLIPGETLTKYSAAEFLLDQLARGRLVGRRTEQETLHHLWKNCLGGQAQMALISGEPGVGKTRLANELLVYARLNGATVWSGGCYEYEAATPYLPFVEALRGWVHSQETEVLRQNLGALAGELAKLAPEIETRLGALPVNPQLSANEERLRLYDHVARLVQSLSIENGLILFIDDIHWADQGTLNLLHYILRNLRSDRVMVLACYREVELDRRLPFTASLVEWNRERLAARISLNRLGLEEVRQLLGSLFGQENISLEFTESVFRETEGNPFFIEEVIKSLIEQGQIYREDGRWQRQEIRELAIPQSVKEAIGRRLDRQSQTGMDVLHTAAALGKRFTFSELAAAVTISESELLDALDEASHAQLIRPDSGENFLFTHDKIREVLYEELNPIRRRKLHLRIGEGLEHLFGLDAGGDGGFQGFSCECDAQELSHHFIEAGELMKGLRYSVAAAELSRRVFALDETIFYYERAIECADALGRKSDLCELYEILGVVFLERGSFGPSISAEEKALELAETAKQRARIRMNIGNACAQTGDDLGRTHLNIALQELDGIDDPLLLARLYTLLGRFDHLHAEYDEAIASLERALSLAEPLDEAAVLMDIYGYLSGAYQQSHRIEESMLWARKCVELGERKDYPSAIALGYEFLAEDSNVIDQWREALVYAELDLKTAEKIGSLSRIAWAKNSYGFAYYGLGELEKALAEVNESLKIIEHSGEERLAALVHNLRALIQSEIGNFPAAWEDVQFVRDKADESGQEQVLAWSYGARVAVLVNQERWKELIQTSMEAQERIGASFTGQRILAFISLDRREEFEEFVTQEVIHKLKNYAEQSLWNYLILALINAYSGDYEQAEMDFSRAISRFEERGGILKAGQTYFRRALFFSDLSRREEALQDARRALEIFEGCGAQKKAEQAKEFITAIGLV
jgi:predicted ATPase